MWTIKASALFKRQLIGFAKDYHKKGGLQIADKFIDRVNEAITFIIKTPLACSIYQAAQKNEVLKHYEFRKWNVKGFPHAVFFRITDEKTILLEAIYAHKMNVTYRMGHDMDDKT